MAVDVDALRWRAEAVRGRILLSRIIADDKVKLIQRGREWVGLCPFHSDVTLGSFSVNDDKALYKCFSCGAHGDHFTYLKERKGLEFIQALKDLEAGTGIDFTDAKTKAEYDRNREKREREQLADAERRRRNAVGLWMYAAPMMGTPAEDYLGGRGIDFSVLGRFPGAIRFRQDCWNTELGRGMPAMVTKITAMDGTHIGTHRTFLDYRRGQWLKAPLEKPKMVLGSFRGGHIALNKGACGRMPLKGVPTGTIPQVSEGIEDGLTVALADPERRVIAAISLDNQGGVDMPEQVRAVELIGQNDVEYRALRALQARQAGDEALALKHERAAREIDGGFERQIARHQEQGREVSCLWPEPEFKDFNDQLRGIRMDSA